MLWITLDLLERAILVSRDRDAAVARTKYAGGVMFSDLFNGIHIPLPTVVIKFELIDIKQICTRFKHKCPIARY